MPDACVDHAALETLEEHLSCDGGANYALAREFIWGDRFPQPVALVTHGGTGGGFGGSSVPAGESVYHYLHDVLGSVVALTNASGQVVERYTYDPYGKTVIEETNPTTGLPTARLEGSAFGNPFAWTGQRYDAGVRLYHFLFRGYSPQLGRWLQRDPLDYVDGTNLYEYASSMVQVLIDAFGLDDDDPYEEGIKQQGQRIKNVKEQIGKGAGVAKTVLETAARLNPISDVAEAATGKDIITGEQLSTGERLIAVAGVIPGAGALDDANDARKILKGAKAYEKYVEHVEKLNKARKRLDDLKDQLKNTKGKKAREALQKEIDALQNSIKGHKKEVRQKWPTPPEPPKEKCPGKGKGDESSGSGGKANTASDGTNEPKP